MPANVKDSYTQGRSATLLDRRENTVKKDLLRIRDRLVVGKWYKIRSKSPLFDDGYKLIRHLIRLTSAGVGCLLEEKWRVLRVQDRFFSG